MNKIIIISLIVTTCISFAQTVTRKDGSTFTLDSEMIRNEEELKRIELSDDQSFEGNLKINIRNEETGVYDSTYDTSDDQNRMSAMFLVNANLGHAMSINTIELQYGKKLNLGWLEFSLGQTTGVLDKIHEEYAYIDQTSVWSESNINRPQNNSEKITTIGFGYGYRFRMFQSLFSDGNFFEHTNVYLTYSLMDDFHTYKNYSGLGLKSDLLIAYRAGKNFYWGLRLSYNLHSLSRAEEAGEPLNQRTLSFSWLTTGLDIGIYY